MKPKVYLKQKGDTIQTMVALNVCNSHNASNKWITAFLPVFKGTLVYIPLNLSHYFRGAKPFAITGYSKNYNAIVEFFDYTSQDCTNLLAEKAF